jgi:polyhydroxyalkanoate synthesis regulator phasin
MNLDVEMKNYNLVKLNVLDKLVKEGLLDQDDADEFAERNQVLVYKGKWFKKWFDNNIKIEDPTADENGYYIKIVEMQDKEDEVDRLMRRTSGKYD